ncbi:MAG: MopE-related protein [Chitinophagales bacterium]
MKKILKLSTLFILMLCLSQTLSAAVITVLSDVPSPGTSGNGRAPQGSRLYINTLYYINPSDMTSSGFGSDLVTSVGWTWQAGTPQNAITTGNLKVYLLSSTDLVYSRGATFSTVGFTKVCDGTITISNSGVQFSIDVPTGGPGTAAFNTIAGQGVYVAFEYQTTTALALPLGAPTVLCNAAVANSCYTYQSQVSYGTFMTASAFRPVTRFGNSNVDYGNVTDVYCLGKLPIPFSNPQSVAARVKNESLSPQSYDVTFTIKEKVSGTVRYTNTTNYSFTGGESKYITAAGWTPTIQETDTVIVSVNTLGGEFITSNNEKGYIHLVNGDTYSYSDNSAQTGGVGFGAGSGQILNKYHITGCANVEAVRVNLFGGTAIGNTVRGVVCNSGGVQVAVSADHVITAGDAGNYFTFTFPTPPGFSNEDIFVGLEQTVNATAYFPVGTQSESNPTRPGAYYSNAYGGGALAGPYTTLNRFMIESVITPLSTDPTASSDDYDLCEGESATLTASFTELSPSSVVNWYTGGCGTTFAGTGLSLFVSPPAGTHTYYVRAEDVCNSYNTACATVVITVGATTIYYADTDGDSYGDAGASLPSCSGTPVGYVLDATDCDDTNAAINPAATEICDGFDNDCNGDTDEGMVTATISTPEGTVICKPGYVTLASNTGIGYTYQWFKNANLIPGAVNPTYQATKAGYYQVQVNIPAGCFDLSDAVLTSVFTGPNANISAPNGTSLCTTVKLKASYAGDYSWQWYLDGGLIGGATSYSYIATVAGDYYCLVSNATCTRQTATMTVSACRAGELSESVNSFIIYPNPTSSQFNIELMLGEEANGQADVYVLNTLGEIIYSANADMINGYINNEINLSNNISSGLYIVKVVVDGKEYNQQLTIIK